MNATPQPARPPSERPLPERFVLDRTQVAAALALGGLRVSPTSPLPNLPPPADPGAALRGTNLLDGRGGLTAAARAALAILAGPQRLLTVRVNRAGHPAWTETNYYMGADASNAGRGAAAMDAGAREAVVALSAGDQGWDLALLPTTLQAAAMVNDHLQLSALPSLPGGRVYDLDLPGFAAALAMADAVQTARLGARLAREPRPLPLLNAEVLAGMLQKGLDTGDTRWAVTSARLASPTNLRAVQDRMADGLASLAAAGLVETGPGGAALTAAGAALAGALGELLNTGALVLAAAGAAPAGDSPALAAPAGADRITVAHTGVFRCATEVWLAVWSAWGPGEGKVQLRQVSGPTAVHFAHSLLAPGGADPVRPVH